MLRSVRNAWIAGVNRIMNLPTIAMIDPQAFLAFTWFDMETATVQEYRNRSPIGRTR